jgi:hypothetical protein
MTYFKVVVMLKDPADYTRMNAARVEYFRNAPPISTCFRAELMREDILVGMEAEALIGARLGYRACGRPESEYRDRPLSVQRLWRGFLLNRPHR